AAPKVITEENWGVNYQALNELFQNSEQRKDVFTYDVVKMIEIYNEQCVNCPCPRQRSYLWNDSSGMSSSGGQAKTLMFVHISPEVDAYGETMSTLKFAERVATVELGAAKSNKESGDIRELKGQIANLKNALANKEAEADQVQITTDSRISPERQRMRSCLSITFAEAELRRCPNTCETQAAYGRCCKNR
ncbi:hypothetical protein KI387_034153, partial [Taxus chinensis]